MGLLNTIIIDEIEFSGDLVGVQEKAAKVDLVEIWARGQLQGGYLSPEAVEHYRRLRQREREVFRTDALPDMLYAELEASLLKFGHGPEG